MSVNLARKTQGSRSTPIGYRQVVSVLDPSLTSGNQGPCRSVSDGPQVDLSFLSGSSQALFCGHLKLLVFILRILKDHKIYACSLHLTVGLGIGCLLVSCQPIPGPQLLSLIFWWAISRASKRRSSTTHQKKGQNDRREGQPVQVPDGQISLLGNSAVLGGLSWSGLACRLSMRPRTPPTSPFGRSSIVF